MTSRRREPVPLSQQDGDAVDLVADPVGFITGLVGGVERGLDRAVLEEAVVRVGGGRAKRRRLAQALSERPAVLTDGRSPAPGSVGDLLIALREAGATAVSPPVCATAGCATMVGKVRRRGQDWYCAACTRAWEPCTGCGKTRKVNTRGREGQPYCQFCRPPGPDPVETIVQVVTAIDPALTAEAVAGAVRAAAWQEGQRRKLAWAVQDRPGLLTGDGAASPVAAVPRLIDALARAGATMIVQPACPRCGTVKPLAAKLGELRICAACSARARAVACSRCGQVRPAGTRDGGGMPVCSTCLASDPVNHEQCTGCGRVRQVTTRTAEGPWCHACRPRRQTVCFICGQARACEISQVTGKPWCTSCQRQWLRCAGCGVLAPVYSGTRARSSCARCTNPDPAFWNRCSACEHTWQLGTRPCERCAVNRKITGRLSGGTGIISENLAPLHQALTAVDRPATARNWLDLPPVRTLLAGLSRDHRPLTHEILDELPAGKTLANLRSILVAAGALPARDERLVQLERWITEVISTRRDGAQRQLMHEYVTWHLTRRLRQRLAASACRPSGSAQAAWHTSQQQAANIRRHVLAVTTLLDLLLDQELTLGAVTQHDLDRWVNQGLFAYPKETGHFIRWALARRHAQGLTFNNPCWQGPAGPHDTEKRWDHARRLLHDSSLPLPDRVAGLLLLLYAQRAAGIASLTTSHIRDDGTSTTSTFGTAPVTLPEPLAGLVRQLAATRRGQAAIGRPGSVPWLFPGGRPGQPLSSSRLGDRLKNIGLQPRQDRGTALFTLASQLPAAILARMLGIHIHAAVQWQKAASGDWMTYAADLSRRPSAATRSDRT